MRRIDKRGSVEVIGWLDTVTSPTWSSQAGSAVLGMQERPNVNGNTGGRATYSPGLLT